MSYEWVIVAFGSLVTQLGRVEAANASILEVRIWDEKKNRPRFKHTRRVARARVLVSMGHSTEPPPPSVIQNARQRARQVLKDEVVDKGGHHAVS